MFGTVFRNHVFILRNYHNFVNNLLNAFIMKYVHCLTVISSNVLSGMLWLGKNEYDKKFGDITELELILSELWGGFISIFAEIQHPLF